MATPTNKHGLTRNIPKKVKQEIRNRSKFGCVVCRSGFYQYEHIDPTFTDAKKHDPSKMCCLCSSCHAEVTTGRLSKAAIKVAYENVQNAGIETVASPSGPIDFHDGSAELLIGGIHFNPIVHNILRYFGKDLITLKPGKKGKPGNISAVFTDEDGNETLRLEENEWIGSLENWDIEIVGPRISVKRQNGKIALQLRLDPPGKITIEYLDMKYDTAHILISENSYAIGRYISTGDIYWMHAQMSIVTNYGEGILFEYVDPKELESRDQKYKNFGQSLASKDRNIIMHSYLGIFAKSLGMVIGSKCGGHYMYQYCIGPKPLFEMRTAVFGGIASICSFLTSHD